MIRQKTGVVLESLRLSIKDGLKTASALGFKGIQIDATHGDISPENLSQTGRRELRRILGLNRLSLCALGGESVTGFTSEDEFGHLIKRIKEIINLALDLQTDIITVQTGSLPADNESAHWHALNTVLGEIGRHAENYGCRLAARASYDNYPSVKKFLGALHTEGIKLIYDPASLIINKLDPVRCIYELHEYIIHTNLWDTRQTDEGRHVEVPIGKGIVPVEGFLSVLESTGYQGFYVIDSRAAQQPVENIRKGKEFLDRI